jgi:hypothetical protein
MARLARDDFPLHMSSTLSRISFARAAPSGLPAAKPGSAVTAVKKIAKMAGNLLFMPVIITPMAQNYICLLVILNGVQLREESISIFRFDKNDNFQLTRGQAGLLPK